MSQTSVNTSMAKGLAGQIADLENSLVNTFLNETAINFGTFLTRKEGSDTIAENPDAAVEITGIRAVGIALHSHANEQAYTGSNEGYAANSAMSVMRKGKCYVSPEDDVTPEDTVYVRFQANGANTQLGAFRSDDDGGTAACVSVARFCDSCAADGIATLEINLP